MDASQETPPVSARSRASSVLIGVLLVCGCKGPQSALQPAGRAAEDIANLFWCMLAGGTVIWLAVIGLAFYAVRTQVKPGNDRRVRLLIIGGGTVVPTVVLSTLLLFSLPMLPSLLAPPPAGSLTINVRGKMWWWRVQYQLPEGGTVELANEIRLPVGEPVEFRLTSDDVIHAFWIPALGGKMDMFPGRDTRLKLEPTRTGVFRGACAEYCGTSHALMSFDVIVMERAEFADWLAGQRAPALTPTEPLAALGQQAFLKSGCHACHAVRGTEARGTVGPDLTHVGSRGSLAAGVLPNERGYFADWIAHPGDLKPGVKMPAFGMLPNEDRQAIAAYLEQLQ